MFYEVSAWRKLTIFYKCGESVYFGSRLKFFILSIQFFMSLEFTDAARGSIKRSSSNFNLDSNPIASYSLHQIQGPHGIKRLIHNELETQNKHPHKWRFSSQKSSKNNTKTEKNKTNSFFNRFYSHTKPGGVQNKKYDLNCSECYNCQPRINEGKPALNSIYSSTERSNTETKPIYLQVNIYMRNTSTDSQRFKEAKPVHFDNLEKFFLIPVQIYENRKQNDYLSQPPLSEYYAFVRNNEGNSQNVGPEYQRYSLDTFQGKPTKNSQIPAEPRYPPISTFGMNVEKKNFVTKQNQFIPPYFSINYFNGKRKNEDIFKANEWLSQLNTNSKNNVQRKQIFAFQPNTENELQKHLLSSLYFRNNLPKYNKQYYTTVDINKN